MAAKRNTQPPLDGPASDYRPIIDVWCATCDAAAGDPCIDNGKPLSLSREGRLTFHIARTPKIAREEGPL